MLDPAAGRARVVQDADRLIVTIKGKRSPFIAAFLGFWLCGWAFGWVAAAGGLMSGQAGSAGLFLIAWLGAWTVGGAVAIGQFLWLVAGFETVEFSMQQIVIKRHLPIWAKKLELRFDDTKGLRAEQSGSTLRSNQMSNWLSRKTGNVQLDYGVHSVGFGIDLDLAEASQLVRTIAAVFPELERTPNA